MTFQPLGILILIVFYGTYFGKMAAQKKQGIQTDHIAKGRKKGTIFQVELAMKAAACAVPAVEIISLITGIGPMPVLVRAIGAAAALAGAACFAVSVCTMRDSWRAGIPEDDKTEIVTTGIYSISRTGTGVRIENAPWKKELLAAASVTSHVPKGCWAR